MLRIFVDSGSSIKQEEKEKYNVEIIPIKIIFDGIEYLDGINISNEEFYDKLCNEGLFPKTSLPSLEFIKEQVERYTNNGDEVLFITISSKISGTFNAVRLLFEDNNLVHVFDSQIAVGGIRLLVEEANRFRDILPVEDIIKKLDDLVPNIHVLAIPETLEYLYRGGRLSKVDKIFADILGIKPIIGFIDGEVKAISKKRGLKNAMKYIVESLKEFNCDVKHSIIASYSYCRKNLDTMIQMLDSKFLKAVTSYDDIDCAIACHWGPNAFGLVFVGEKNEK